ncbi:MAG: YneF family protein [Erysipelotrichaceae bacterium]|nr:YneF family protein [Erysipelotrichaceae bacterium]MBQ4252311.1 YneF family protein [Erysipelotrichaceae bacterium]MBQ7223563.1 YneF family protein [Erysipelotrichaceae bacterium]
MPTAVVTLLYILLGCAIGAAAGWYFTRRAFEKQLKENPPVNEKMIRAMFLQMGRKPSEAQIKAVMKSMNQYQ